MLLTRLQLRGSPITKTYCVGNRRWILRQSTIIHSFTESSIQFHVHVGQMSQTPAWNIDFQQWGCKLCGRQCFQNGCTLAPPLPPWPGKPDHNRFIPDSYQYSKVTGTFLRGIRSSQARSMKPHSLRLHWPMKRYKCLSDLVLIENRNTISWH